MAHNNIEIEIKVRIENVQTLLDFLDKNGQFQGEHHQVDEYFTPAHKDYVSVRPVDEWLRLREQDGKFSINYKLWHRDENGKSLYCDEVETSVGSTDQMRKIFTALECRSLIVVDKIRKAWIYNDYEVAVDSVKNLGDFVEIEYMGKDEAADPKEITSQMLEFLHSLNCGTIKEDNVGYPYLLLFEEEQTQ